ncbi:MAG: diguanylate cyclase [Methylotenera sp.]|nr:diguanylate cyclase [Methylotenera sp.]
MAVLDYRKQIIFPLITASVILLIAMLWIFISAEQLIQLGKKQVKIEETRYEITILINAMIEAETGQRGYLLTGNVQFLEPYERSLNSYSLLLENLSDITKDFPSLTTRLQGLPDLIDQKFDIIKRNIQTELNAGSFAPHLRPTDSDGKIVMDQIRSQLQGADQDLAKLGNEVRVLVKTKLKELVMGSIITMSLIIGILLFSYYRTIWLFENAKNNLRLAEQFGHLAMHDALTFLPNRRSFNEHLEQTLASAQRKKTSFALFYMDLDGFKRINDNYGHDAGDEALIATVNRIKRIVRTSEFLARVGGDEFALIVENFETIQELEHLAHRIIAALDEKPILSILTQDIKLGISIGIASYPEHAQDIEALVTAADSAMYLSKNSGKNQFRIFDSAQRA